MDKWEDIDFSDLDSEGLDKADWFAKVTKRLDEFEGEAVDDFFRYLQFQPTCVMQKKILSTILLRKKMYF